MQDTMNAGERQEKGTRNRDGNERAWGRIPECSAINIGKLWILAILNDKTLRGRAG